MRLMLVVVVVGCVALMPAVGRAEGDAGPGSDAKVCAMTRPSRVKVVQIRTKQWLDRVAAMRAACTAGWVKTGAAVVNGNRIAPEMRGDVKCPKGPPSGETKESVWAALSLFLPEPVVTDEVLTADVEGVDETNLQCMALDAAEGINLRPLVNDMPTLRRILAWKPPTKK